MKLLYKDGFTNVSMTPDFQKAIRAGLAFLFKDLNFKGPAPTLYKKALGAYTVGQTLGTVGKPYIVLHPFIVSYASYEVACLTIKHELLHYFLVMTGEKGFGDGDETFERLANNFDLPSNVVDDRGKSSKIAHAFHEYYMDCFGVTLVTADYKYLEGWRSIPKTETFNATFQKYFDVLDNAEINKALIVYHAPTNLDPDEIKRSVIFHYQALALYTHPTDLSVLIKDFNQFMTQLRNNKTPLYKVYGE